MYGGRTTGVGEGEQTEVVVPGMQVWYQGRWQIGVERLLESEYSRLLLSWMCLNSKQRDPIF